MNKIIWCVLIAVLLVGFGDNGINSDLPIQIGQSRTEVKQILGSPGRTGDDFDSFFGHGLIAKYDTTNKVVSIEATRLKSGVEFRGRILGVSIGDHVTKCVELWGNPEKWDTKAVTLLGFEFSSVFFRHEGYRIELEVWHRDGTNSSFGTYKRGAIKNIRISKDKTS